MLSLPHNTASIAFVFFVIVIIGLVFTIVALLRTRRIMQKKIDEKADALDRTSRLLIEKHLEVIEHNERLQRLLDAKTDFIAVASHQLRTPITEIKWGIEFLLIGMLKPVLHEQQVHLEKLLDSAKRMVRLFNELLLFVATEAGSEKNVFSPTNLDQIVREVATEIASRELFAKKHITLAMELSFGDTLVPADVEMMRVVFTNLITNAFQYTPENKHVRIITRKEQADFYFEITDEGVGISEERQHFVFQKFKRTRETLRMHASGIGLGLYIVKNIIERHNGTIAFTSEHGQGTTFHLTIPTQRT